MGARVAVVILNYNTRDLLERFIPSILSTSYPDYELIIADNASSDDSVEWLKNNYPQVRLICLDANHGYAGGYNLALDQVNAEIYVLLNSDVEVSHGWLEPVIEAFSSDPGIAAIQPKILDYKNRASFEYAGASGGFIDKYGYPFCRGRLFDYLENDSGQYDDSAQVFWASGACLCIRSDAWKQAGGLDQDFFAHMEEIDLCWRLGNLGYKLYCVPGSVVYHIGGGTLSQQSSRKTYLNFRNGLALLAKNLPTGRLFPIIFFRLILDHIAAYRFLAIGKSQDFRAVARAHYHFLKRLRFWLKKRKEIPAQTSSSFGIYPRSIVIEYFLKKKKTYSALLWPRKS